MGKFLHKVTRFTPINNIYHDYLNSVCFLIKACSYFHFTWANEEERSFSDIYLIPKVINNFEMVVPIVQRSI